MKERRHIYRWIILAIFMASLCTAAIPAAGDDAKRVAIFPFQIHSEKDLSFLQKGIVDMLSSRLAQTGKVAVVSRQEMEQVLAEADGPMEIGQAKRLGEELGADYVLFGSLTVFGNSVSIDAKMVDVLGEAEPVAVFSQSEMGQVITEINQFAIDINEKVFGQATVAKKPSAPAEQPAPSPEAAAPKETTPEIYAHPEKMIQGGFGLDGTPESGKLEKIRYWKSRNFTHPINGLALGDVDGDGNIETVIASPNHVLVYRYEKNRFFEVGITDPVKSRVIVGLDAADINGNGIPEIFVSALNAQRTGVASRVMEYDGSGFRVRVHDAPYYFRVSELPDRGSVLFGQGQRVGGSPFSSPVYEMHWDGNRYGTQNRVLPSRKANLLGFSMGDPMNSGQETILAFDPADKLRILEPSGKEIWISGSRSGGSTLFLTGEKQDKGEDLHKVYLPMRVRIVDVEGDGQYEVAAVSNKEVTGGRLSQFRLFTKTEMVIMSWDGIGLAPVWKTRSMSGMIRDLAVGDFDNDGKNEMVGALIFKEGTTIGIKGKSAIIAMDLDQAVQ